MTDDGREGESGCSQGQDRLYKDGLEGRLLNRYRSI
jgi:hypothetical protein